MLSQQRAYSSSDKWTLFWADAGLTKKKDGQGSRNVYNTVAGAKPSFSGS